MGRLIQAAPERFKRDYLIVYKNSSKDAFDDPRNVKLNFHGSLFAAQIFATKSMPEDLKFVAIYCEEFDCTYDELGALRFKTRNESWENGLYVNFDVDHLDYFKDAQIR